MRAPTRLILHIGTEKTGTTAIQDFLFTNRRQLARHRIYVPTFLGRRNHRWIVAMAYSDGRDDSFIRKRGLSNARLRRGVLALMRWRLRWSARRRRGCTWIVSSENLHSQLTGHPADLERLQQLTTALFDEVRILVYLRRPLDTAVALWSTGLRYGGTIQQLPPPDRPRWQQVCDHRRTLESWETWFPTNVMPRLFDRDALRDRDLISDFCAVTGIPADPNLLRPGRVNESLSAAAMALLARVNRLRTSGSPTRPINPEAEGLCELLERHGAGLSGYQPTERERDSYEAHYQASDAWTRSTYFPERASLWSDNPPRSPAADANGGQANHGRDMEHLAAAAITELWQRQQGRHRLRRLRHTLEACLLLLRS